MASFLGEIKRRKVFQVAAVYAVVAWLLVQVVSTIEAPLNLPDWVDTLVIVLLTVGFPVAIILSWAFDVTPSGIQPTSDPGSIGQHAQSRAQSFSYISQLLVLLAVGFLVFDQYVLNNNGGMAILRSPDARITRFVYDLPPGQTFRNDSATVIALSPDGRQFAYNTESGLYLRRMDQLEAQPIMGTESPLLMPTFSPDGREIAFFEASRLLRIATTGGSPVHITDLTAPLASGLSWEADGTILIANLDGIFRVPAAGGVPELLISPLDKEFLSSPQLLPDGDSVLFTSSTTELEAVGQIILQSIATGKRTILLESGTDARYLPTGHLVYTVGNSLLGAPFDLETLTVSGGPVPLVQEVSRTTGLISGPAGLMSNYSVAANGTLIFVERISDAASRTLVWVDREGSQEAINFPARAYTSPRLSPDGTKVALSARDQLVDVWIWDFARETLGRLSFGPGLDRFPVWSPDGRWIVYSYQSINSGSVDSGVHQLLQRLADGSGPEEQLAVSNGQIFPTAFLPNGTGLLFYGAAAGADVNDDIGLFPLQGDDGLTSLLASSTFAESMPEISPDGRWLAYVSNESGDLEVYVRPFPGIGVGGRWQVSTSGGSEPLWSRDGRELFYRNNGSLVAVSVETGANFSQGVPHVVLEGEFFGGEINQGGRSYDVSLDGQRFLMIKQSDVRDRKIIVIENWAEELIQAAAAAH